MNSTTQVATDYYPPVAQAAKFVTPFELGAMDARQGELCIAEMYFVSLVQMRQYAMGHESVVGRTKLSGQLLRKGGK